MRAVFAVRAKGTPFAAQQAAYEAAKKAHEAGMQQCEVRVKGPGGGRESAIRAIANAGIQSDDDSRYDADSAQWMPSAEAAQSLEIFDLRFLIFDWFLKCGDAADGSSQIKNLKSKI